MKVLVTGGTGFTGSHTALALRAAGHAVRLFVRDPAKVRRVFEPHGVVLSDVVVGDMADAAAVEKALAGCDGVVHSAGGSQHMGPLHLSDADSVRRTFELNIWAPS